ncbi:hypothetical protein BPAE_0398g00070 [Botrytis paeoniae]|uniref:Uncharacterized protein n=1 Tax=Botrytis paeoniae TaxID=278948 RepID=A0A4Z1F0G1_9HELO|nr:hypothetical protein BPAE_0398g00070 [Botrytis paeoniae]
MVATQWGVNSFKIRGYDSALFANGVMQVAVEVDIKATVPGTSTPYTMTDAELEEIELVDDDLNALSGGWSFSSTENDFNHTIPSSAQSDISVPELPSADVQTKTYWVSTSKTESKTVYASIQQPDGTVITTHSDKYDSKVELQGRQPTVYTLSNTNFENYEVDHDDKWRQYNYFLSSKEQNQPFKTCERHNYVGESDPIVGLRDCYWFARQKDKDNSHERRIQYFWDMGPERIVTVGVTNYKDGTPIPENPAPTITINQKADAMCFTWLDITSPTHVYTTSFWYDTWFIVWDVYGNSGEFTVDTGDNSDDIVIHERNTSTSKSSHGGEIHYGDASEAIAQNTSAA